MAPVQSFGRYRVTGTLGAGAMGEVYAAEDEVLGRQVAVKTLRGRQSGLAARMADERFRLEARAIAQLTHPSVVQVFDLDLTADPPYLVMERVAGPSLKERLTRGPLASGEAIALGIQIGNALAAAHARGVVHRDVKPANILAAEPGAWKLADFGVAHVPDSSLTLTGQFVGSPAYAPPEALVRGECGPAGDVFGLGATLYEAIAGAWPRGAQTTAGLLAPVPPLATAAPHVAPALAAAIDRAVAIDAGARPSAAELAQALAASAAELPAPAAAVAIPGAPGRAETGAPGSSPDAGPAATAAAASARRKHRIAGIATLLAVALIAATRCSPDAPTDTAAAVPAWQVPAPPPPATIHAAPPPIREARAAKDWKKVVDKLRDGELGEARRKLAEWERRHGEFAETRSLASQLDALPEHVLRAGRDDD